LAAAALPSVIGGPGIDFIGGAAFLDAALAPDRVPPVSVVGPVSAVTGLPAASRGFGATF
jgi:hypothetical protein